MLETVDFRKLYEKAPKAPDDSDFNKFKEKYLDDNFNLMNDDIKGAVEAFEQILITYKENEKGDYQLGTYDVETCNIDSSFSEECLRLNKIQRK